MTYEKAISVLKEYNKWRNSEKGHRKPRHEEVTEAIETAIETMQDILEGNVVSSPEEMRFESLKSLIEDFVQGNKS